MAPASSSRDITCHESCHKLVSLYETWAVCVRYKCASVRVCKYASMQVCEYASMQIRMGSVRCMGGTGGISEGGACAARCVHGRGDDHVCRECS